MVSRACWIWHSGEASPRNSYLYCRRRFVLPSLPDKCPVQVTADSRYILYVNGTFAGRGPIRGDDARQFVDTWDIAPLLRPGENVIAAVVHHYGESTFAYLHRRGGFLLEGQVPQKKGAVLDLDTGGTWRVCPSAAWEPDLPRISIQQGYPEVFDARLAPEGWNAPGFDDAAWPAATVVAPAGDGPWPELAPRDIPPLYENIIRADAVIGSGNVEQKGQIRLVHLNRVIHIPWGARVSAYARTSIFSPVDQKATLSFGSAVPLRAWYRGKPVVENSENRQIQPDQDKVRVDLKRGWNRVLLKTFKDVIDLSVFLRVVPSKDEAIRLHAWEDAGGPAFAVLGPIPQATPEEFKQSHEAETNADLAAVYPQADGHELRWVPSIEHPRWHELPSVRIEYAQRRALKKGTLTAPQNLTQPGRSVKVRTEGEAGVHLTVDFGREVVGFPRLSLRGARGGEVLELGYSELLEDGRVVANRKDVYYGDRYTARPGNQDWELFDKRAFRYLQLDVYNASKGIEIRDLALNFTTYDTGERGSFQCSDELLNRIWEVGAWSVRLNMEDAYTDCPWRERAQWMGDMRIEALVNYVAFGDLDLIRHGLRQMAVSQREDGLVMGCYPAEENLLLPDFALVWILILHDYYHQSGDRALVRELWPVAKKILGFFQRHEDKHGLLYRVPHWNFIDWAPMGLWGESAPMNGYYVLALDAAADLAGLLNKGKRAADYRQRAATVRAALRKRLYDKGWGVLRDCRDGNRRAEVYSQAGNSLALLGGVFEQDEQAGVLDRLLSDDERLVPVGTPFFAFYLLSALFQAGEHGRALQYIRTRWKTMLDAGATTWWEHWNPEHSLCHGWGAGPTYFLSREFLGVRRAAPGWKAVRVEPVLADLDWCKGTVPSPRGDIHAAWKRLKMKIRYDLELPDGVRAEVLLPGEPQPGEVLKVRKLSDGARGWKVKGPGKWRFEAGF